MESKNENVQSVQSVQVNEDFSLFPQEVYQYLPEILNKIDLIPMEYTSDIALLSLLTSIGSCLPNVFCYYADERQYTNLYSFIVSPPANNKRFVEFGFPIVRRIHDIFYLDSELKLLEYENLSREDKKKTKAPPQKIKILPGDTTDSKLIRHLKENYHSLIIPETEADSLTNQLNSAYGGYSEKLRKIFGNEFVGKSTMKDNRLEYIYLPKLSMLLSGVPASVTNLIKSSNDGLFSRFCFLCHLEYTPWKNIKFNRPNEDSDDVRKELIEFAEKIHEILYENDNAIEVLFSDKQQSFFNLEYQKIHDSYYIENKEIIPTIRRMGMSFSRISTILTILRNEESILSNEELKINKKYKIEIQCHDIDFENAMRISKVLMNHSLMVLGLLSKKPQLFKTMQEKIFYDSLPNEFTTDFAIKSTTEFSESWVKKRLAKYSEIGILSKGHGKYSKII